MDFMPTGVSQKDYLDVIECVVDAYGTELLEQQLTLEDSVYHFTAFRTSVMLAYLIHSGRRPELLPLWQRVTEKSVRALEASRNSAYNDMTLEELCICFLLMKEHVKPQWLDVLRKVDPWVHYSFMTKEQMNNMVVYGAVGLYLREKLTGVSCAAHFDMVMPWILERIDENGMFDDHDHALLYDLTTRVRLEQLLWFGYDGPWAKTIADILSRSGEMTLLMQSAAFQIPYGGRSNQFLHNEALLTSLFEYEACRWKKRGNRKKAGEYKRAAHLSFLTLKRYLELPGGAKHIRNLFPQDSLYGIDDYGTFPRYMNALATFIACGYLACDDTIPEKPCPAELGGYVVATTERFGKIFANAAGQSVEYAILADPGHEAPGLGRYHAAGVPAELGLSLPFTETPVYLLSRGRIPFRILGPKHVMGEFSAYLTDIVPSQMLAFSPSYRDTQGNRQLLCQKETPSGYEILEKHQNRVSFRVRWPSAWETVTLDSQGLHLFCSLTQPDTAAAFWAIPLLTDNGGEQTNISVSEHRATVTLKEAVHTVTSDDNLCLTQQICGNRNGIYRVLYADSNTRQCSVLLKLMVAKP